jgi:hypothetical protein
MFVMLPALILRKKRSAENERLFDQEIIDTCSNYN